MRHPLSCRVLLLLAGLGALPGTAQVPLPPGTLTPETLTGSCAAEAGASCTLTLDGRYILGLHGDWQLPRSLHLRFDPGSTLDVRGGTLQFAGGSIDASPTELIFPAPDRIRGLAATRPEWFAPALSAGPQEPVPGAALAAAFQATEPWGTIYLAPRRYLSPFTGCRPGSLRYLSPRTFVGAGRPHPDDGSAPTRLQGGTILLGPMVGSAPLRLAHLGLDAGPQVVQALPAGCGAAGIFIEQPPSHEFVSGDRLQDVSVLTTGAFNMHSVMLAGHRNTEIRDLWIWTLGGTHGLVMKSSDSVVDGLHCFGAVSDCLIVKSDYATSFLGRAAHDRIAHVDIRPLKPGDQLGGIVIESRWDTVRDLEMTDIAETGTHFGIILLGSTFYRPRNINIRHWTADAVSGICLFSDKADAVQVSDFRCGLTPNAQAGAVLRLGRDTQLRHGDLRCQGEPAACAAGRTDGIQDDAFRTSLQQLTAEGLGGYALRSSHGAFPDTLRTGAMGARAYAPLTVPFSERLHDAFAQTRPNLRIVYTAVLSRLRYQPRLSGMLAAAFVSLAGLAAFRRNIRRRTNT